jgi:hypothetical protein
MNWSLDLGIMITTGFWNPLNTTLNYRNPSNIDPFLAPQISILHTNREYTNYHNRVTTWYE